MGCDCSEVMSSSNNYPLSGVKISSLSNIDNVSSDDYLVVVDYSNMVTKKVTVGELTSSVSGFGVIDTNGDGTYLRTSGSWVEFDPDSKVDTSAMGDYVDNNEFSMHIDDDGIHYPISVVEKLVTATSGDTGMRPNGVRNGYLYYDTTLGYPIWMCNNSWINATGAVV